MGSSPLKSTFTNQCCVFPFIEKGIWGFKQSGPVSKTRSLNLEGTMVPKVVEYVLTNWTRQRSELFLLKRLSLEKRKLHQNPWQNNKTQVAAKQPTGKSIVKVIFVVFHWSITIPRTFMLPSELLILYLAFTKISVHHKHREMYLLQLVWHQKRLSTFFGRLKYRWTFAPSFLLNSSKLLWTWFFWWKDQPSHLFVWLFAFLLTTIREGRAVTSSAHRGDFPQERTKTSRTTRTHVFREIKKGSIIMDKTEAFLDQTQTCWVSICVRQSCMCCFLPGQNGWQDPVSLMRFFSDKCCVACRACSRWLQSGWDPLAISVLSVKSSRQNCRFPLALTRQGTKWNCEIVWWLISWRGGADLTTCLCFESASSVLLRHCHQRISFFA